MTPARLSGRPEAFCGGPLARPRREPYAPTQCISTVRVAASAPDPGRQGPCPAGAIFIGEGMK